MAAKLWRVEAAVSMLTKHRRGRSWPSRCCLSDSVGFCPCVQWNGWQCCNGRWWRLRTLKLCQLCRFSLHVYAIRFIMLSISTGTDHISLWILINHLQYLNTIYIYNKSVSPLLRFSTAVTPATTQLSSFWYLDFKVKACRRCRKH